MTMAGMRRRHPIFNDMKEKYQMSALSEHYAGKECPGDKDTYEDHIEYIKRLQTYVNEDGRLSHQNGIFLLSEVRRLQGLVPRYLGGTR